MIFQSENIELFFGKLYSAPSTYEQAIETIGEALECVKGEIHLVKMVSRFSIPTAQMQRATNGDEKIVFDTGCETGECLTYEYRVGDGGKAELRYYLEKGYAPADEEIADIHFLSDSIQMIMGHAMTRQLLGYAISMDMMAGVPNMAAFDHFVSNLMKKGELAKYAALYINVHNFKYVNSTLSYQSGNEILHMYAERLQSRLEKGEMICRLGGDSFILVIFKEHMENVLKIVRHVKLEYPTPEKTYRFDLGATIGASYLENISEIGEVFMRISVAFQIARQREGGKPVFFTNDIYQNMMKQKEIAVEFEKALEKEEFVVYYQPKVKPSTRVITGAEALVRWKRDGRIIPPVEFLNPIERDGGICKLDFYVLEKVCQMLSRLYKQKHPIVKTSVNFSRHHMENPNLANEIAEVIDKYDIPHKYIEIELTETEDFRDYEAISKLVNELRKVGVSTSIDDFGTGYSSLNMLRLAEIDLLKIDRTFIQMEEEFERKFRDLVMFKNIVRMAKELGIQIVAEGVETEQQYEYLTKSGCDMVQGFYFDKPLPEEEFLERLKIGKYE